jgi:hypothetical protein
MKKKQAVIPRYNICVGPPSDARTWVAVTCVSESHLNGTCFLNFNHCGTDVRVATRDTVVIYPFNPANG